MSKKIIENLAKKNIDRQAMIQAGFQPQKYDDVQRGKSSYRIEELIEISEKFQLSLDYLVYGKEKNSVPILTCEELIPHYEDCYVACLDILGFSKYIRKNSIDDIHNIFMAYFSVKQASGTNPQGTAFTTKEMAKLKFHLVSDTIIISLKKSENRALEMLVFAVDIIIHNVMINSNLMVRGAISEGEFFSCDINNCFWGEALVKAHELENKIAVYPRVIIPPALFKEYEEKVTDYDKKSINYLVKKDFIAFDSFYVVNYIRYILDRMAVNDNDIKKVQKRWEKLINYYEERLFCEKNPHIYNKYLYFAKYYNSELSAPSELFVSYKSRPIDLQYDDFVEEQSSEHQELIDLYDQLTERKKGEVDGFIKGILNEQNNKSVKRKGA